VRGMILIALLVAILTVGAGAAVIVAGGGDGRDRADIAGFRRGCWRAVTASGEPTTAPEFESVSTVTPAGIVPTQSAEQTQSTPATGALPALPVVSEPALSLPINGKANVESIYSETHPIGNFTIRWRPGAFPPEKANEVAAIAAESLATVNQKLGTNDTDHIDIFLADALFNDECIGCQGFAASDLRQVFILQDGSVSAEELPSLLTHEIGHVMAGNYIALPETLFFAEGLATWLSDDDIVDNGFISPRQSAAWALKAGVVPPIDTLLEGDFAGRVRARAEYDAAASFTYFVVDTYGFDAYKAMYIQSALNPEGAAEVGVGKDWATLEQEWHAYLSQWQDTVINGVTAEQFWSTGEQVMAGFRYLYLYPDQVSSEQYASLTQARLEWNRVQLDTAAQLATQANLPAGVAN
jgi:hypothetical protein